MPALFTKHLFDLTSGLLSSANSEIASINLDDPSKVNDIATGIYSNHALQPISLLEDKKSMDSDIRSCELYDYLRNRSFFRDCEVYIFTIPFEGTWQLFEYHASTFRMEYTEAEVSSNVIKIEIVDEHNSPEQVLSQFNQTLDSIRWNLDKINPEIRNYDSQLRSIVTSGI